MYLFIQYLVVAYAFFYLGSTPTCQYLVWALEKKAR
jgi:hypothetical protein